MADSSVSDSGSYLNIRTERTRDGRFRVIWENVPGKEDGSKGFDELADAQSFAEEMIEAERERIAEANSKARQRPLC